LSGYGRGIDFLNKQRERYASQQSGIRKLWLTHDGDIARFRFLTEGDQFFSHVFHEVQKVSTRGKGYTKDVLCKRRLDADGEYTDSVEACELCTQGVAGWWKAIAWVYVQWIAHRSQDDDKWVKRQSGQQILYME
jgi:hypothetical protein